MYSIETAQEIVRIIDEDSTPERVAEFIHDVSGYRSRAIEGGTQSATASQLESLMMAVYRTR